MFLVLCSMGWVVWQHRDEIRWQPDVPPPDPQIRERVVDAVLTAFGNEECFMDLRGDMAWRPREERYRLEIEVRSGQTCEDASTMLCKRIALLIRRESGHSATVLAYDSGGRRVGRFVQ